MMDIREQNKLDVALPTYESKDDFLNKVQEGGADLYELARSRREIPDKSQVVKSFNVNRSLANPKGVWQRAVLLERRTLKEGLKKFAKELEINDKNLDWIDFFPNSRFPWLNKLTKNVLKTHKISYSDMAALKSVWMDESRKNDMIEFFSQYVDGNIQGYTVPPIPSKGGIPIEYDAKTGNMVAKIRNPGKFVVDRPTFGYHQLGAHDIAHHDSEYNPPIHQAKASMPSNRQLLEFVNSVFNRAYDDEDELLETEPVNHLSMDSAYLRSLKDLNSAMKGINWDLATINDLINELYKRGKNYGNLYLKSVFFPELELGAKVPSIIPIPTASIHKSAIIQIQVNETGFASWAFAPFFYQEGVAEPGLSTFAVNNDATNIGQSTNNNYKAVYVEQTIPSKMYRRYRLVSAAMITTYTGSSTDDSGTIAQALDYFTCDAVPIGATIPEFQTYAATTKVNKCFFVDTINVNEDKRRHMKTLFIPTDENDRLFYPTGSSANRSILVGYATGLPKGKACIQVTVHYNYELIPMPEYTNQVMTTVYSGGHNDLEEAREAIGSLSVHANAQPELFRKVLEETSNKLTSLPIIPNPLLKDKREDAKGFFRRMFDKVIDLVRKSESPLGYAIDLFDPEIPWQKTAKDFASKALGTTFQALTFV